VARVGEAVVLVVVAVEAVVAGRPRAAVERSPQTQAIARPGARCLNGAAPPPQKRYPIPPRITSVSRL
jgi:hypothetical protein